MWQRNKKRANLTKGSGLTFRETNTALATSPRAVRALSTVRAVAAGFSIRLALADGPRQHEHGGESEERGEEWHGVQSITHVPVFAS